MKERYSKPKMRLYNYFTAGPEGAERQDACDEFKDAVLQELLPKLEWICRKITKALEYLKGKLEAK